MDMRQTCAGQTNMTQDLQETHNLLGGIWGKEIQNISDASKHPRLSYCIEI